MLKGNWNSLRSSHGIIVILLFLYPLTRILLPFLLYPSLETNILHTGWTTNDLRIWIIDLMTQLCKITKSKEFLLWSSSTNEIDRDACSSGPTNYFVGFQNPRFTQKFTRNALDWMKLDQITSNCIRKDQIGSDRIR